MHSDRSPMQRAPWPMAYRSGPAMAGQSLLAVAAMLAQSVANVRTIESVKPLSLYCLTIGESGDGKSSGDTVAQSAVQARQRAEAREYLEQVRDAQTNAKDRPKGEPPEELPPEPYRIARDGTVEGIRRSFAQGVPSQGVFSSEAAAMLSGYGMNPDNRAKTAATFNALWDDGELSVSRAPPAACSSMTGACRSTGFCSRKPLTKS
jgi:hypothetical protein